MPHIATRANGFELIEHRRLHRAANILEIRIDAVGAGRLEFSPQIDRAMIDAIVEAQAVLHPQALVGTAGDADDPRPARLAS